MKKIIIIGGGIGGLATAALLGKDGYDVTLIEKNEKVGGRASVFKKNGFLFDMGPSWYMMPDAFEHYFSLFGKKPSDFYNLIKLDPRYTVFFDNKKFTLTASLKENKKLFDSLEPNGGKKLQQFVDDSEYLYKLAMNELVYFDYASLIPFLSPKILAKLFTMKLFSTFHQDVASRFNNPYLQKIIEFTTVFLGGSPYITPAFYTLIAHTDFNLHIWHPEGGIYKVIDALVALCRQHNVTIKTNEEVLEIKTKNGKVNSIRTSKDTYKTDIVVANADYAYTETQLLKSSDQTYPLSYWEKKTLSPSALMIYVGINKKLKNISHHNLYFSEDWDTHFKEVYDNPIWPQNPSYYVNIPSVTDPHISPKNSEAIIFLVPVSPHLQDAGEERTKLANNIISHFEKTIKQPFQKNIVVKKLFSHRDFQSEYNAFKGAAFGIAHTLLQTGPFRPNNKNKKVTNLFYVGQYTNPGIGLPPCLISAEIVYNLITNES